jgi:hypothetical protein
MAAMVDCGAVHQPVHLGDLLGRRCPVLLRPTPDLAAHIAFSPAEVGKPGGRRIDGMKPGDGGVELIEDGGALRSVGIGHEGFPDDAAGDKVHHVKNGTNDALVAAQQMRAGDGKA